MLLDVIFPSKNIFMLVPPALATPRIFQNILSPIFHPILLAKEEFSAAPVPIVLEFLGSDFSQKLGRGSFTIQFLFLNFTRAHRPLRSAY